MQRLAALLLAAAPACVHASGAAAPVRPGVEVFVEHPPAVVRGKRVGLITNQSGIDRQRRSTIDLLRASTELTLVALYSPEHGIRGIAETRVTSSVDEKTGLPVHSLYGETYKPTPRMLEGIDVVGSDRAALGQPIAEHPATRGGDPLPGHGVLRSDQRLGGARHGPALRANRRALAQEHRRGRGDERDATPGHPLRNGRVPGRGVSEQVSRPAAQRRPLHPDGPRRLPAACDLAPHDRSHPPAAPGPVPVGGLDDRAPRRHRAAAPGDRVGHAAGAAPRVGARSGGVPGEASPISDLPLNKRLGALLVVTTLALGPVSSPPGPLPIQSSPPDRLSVPERGNGLSFLSPKTSSPPDPFSVPDRGHALSSP